MNAASALSSAWFFLCGVFLLSFLKLIIFIKGHNSQSLLPPAVAWCQDVWQQCQPKIFLIFFSLPPPPPSFLPPQLYWQNSLWDYVLKQITEQIWLKMQACSFFVWKILEKEKPTFCGFNEKCFRELNSCPGVPWGEREGLKLVLGNLNNLWMHSCIATNRQSNFLKSSTITFFPDREDMLTTEH